MTLRKGELMRKRFGEGAGICKECYHLMRYNHRTRKCFKCDVYGDTFSEATDWKATERACGQKNLPYYEEAVVRLVVPERKPEDDIEGQISLF